MDIRLDSLMNLNEKRRMYQDGWHVNPGDFSIFDIVEEKPEVIDVEPIDPFSERQRSKDA